MARTINEIYNQMVTEKQNMTSLNALQPSTDTATNLLNELSSSSKVAIWRLKFYVVAVAIWFHETNWDVYYKKLQDQANKLYVGTLPWYRDQCFYFQYGDSLSYIDNHYVYATIDPSKQIIKRASVNDVGGQVRIKVAKLSGTTPVALSAPELTAFSSYLNSVKIGGTNLSIVSRDADLLKIYYNIVYDPLLLTSSGELISSPGTYPVEDAINNYISNLPFDGVLNITKLTDEIQNATGVIDPIINNAEAKYGTLAYAPINNNYNADAGHMKIDPSYPLNTTLNYVLNA